MVIRNGASTFPNVFLFLCSIPPNTWPDRHCKGIEIVVPHGHDISSCCCLLNQKRLWMIASKRFLSNSHDFLARWVELSTHQRIDGSKIRKRKLKLEFWNVFPLFLKSLQVINFSQEVRNQRSSDENKKKFGFLKAPVSWVRFSSTSAVLVSTSATSAFRCVFHIFWLCWAEMFLRPMEWCMHVLHQEALQKDVHLENPKQPLLNGWKCWFPTISQVKVWFIVQLKQPQKYGCLGYQVYVYVCVYMMYMLGSACKDCKSPQRMTIWFRIGDSHEIHLLGLLLEGGQGPMYMCICLHVCI